MTEFDVALEIEISAASVSTRRPPSTRCGPRGVEMFGSEWAKSYYLPKVTCGELRIAIAISEPEAGSDSRNMVTTVEKADDRELYPNGEKTWVSDVPNSEAVVVWTRFPEELGTILIEFDQPIGKFQRIRWKVADMAKRLEASRTLTYRTALTATTAGNPPDPLETSIARLPGH